MCVQWTPNFNEENEAASPKCKISGVIGWLLLLFFCSNVPLVVLIHPCKFQELHPQGKKSPTEN